MYFLRWDCETTLARLRPRLSGVEATLVALPELCRRVRIRPGGHSKHSASVMFPASATHSAKHPDRKWGAWAESPPGEQVSPRVVLTHTRALVCIQRLYRHVRSSPEALTHLSGASVSTISAYSIFRWGDSHLNNFPTIKKNSLSCLLST